MKPDNNLLEWGKNRFDTSIFSSFITHFFIQFLIRNQLIKDV